MSGTIDYTLGLKQGDSVAQVDRVKKALNDTTAAAEETESASKSMAAAMEAKAQQAEDALKNTVEIAERLGQALGPELAAKIGQSRINDAAGDFHRAGISAQDLEGNIDGIADSIRRMDAVGDKAKDLGVNMHNVGLEADQSRSVMANFTGNAIQELPGMTGMFGPLNMAIGQFGEYAAEGNIKLKNLLLTGAGIAAVAWVMKGLADHQQRIADSKAFNDEQVKAYEDSLRDAETAVEGIADALTEAGKIELNLNKVADWAFGVLDVTSAVTSLGLTVDNVAALIAGGESKIDDWAATLLQAGADAETVNIVVAALKQQLGFYETATKGAALTTEFLGKKATGTADDIGILESATRSMTTAWQTLNGELSDSSAFENLKLAIGELSDQLAAIAEQETEGAITAEEAASKRILAINDTKQKYHDYIEQVLQLPPSVATTVDLLIDQGKWAEVEELIAELTRTRQARIEMTTERGDQRPSVGSNRYSASGGTSPGGSTIVGEHGPERIDLPPGARVHNAGDTARMLDRGGDTINNYINVALPSQTPDTLVDTLGLFERRNARTG
jgi:hypothetical protein